MSRIAPLTFEDLDAELQPLMSAGNEMMGFMPNDGLIMARKPAVLRAMQGLCSRSTCLGRCLMS